VLIGLLLAQGLFYGLRHLLIGVVLATLEGATSAETLSSNRGVVLGLSIQVLALLIGGAIAGVGQRYGIILGAVIGVWNGALSAMLEQGPAGGLIPSDVYVQPVLHAFVAGVGGAIGCLIWRPLPTQAPVGPVPARKAPARRRKPLFEGPVAWVRVVLGTALAVAGALTAAMLFEKMLTLGGGKLGTTTELQDRIITWEIKALAMILGGALAGANTSNGMKQGLFVGLFSGFVLVGLLAQRTANWMEPAFYTFASALALALAGGWFGGQLFPPVVKAPTERTIGPGAMA
jgi:hypothetical protein